MAILALFLVGCSDDSGTLAPSSAGVTTVASASNPSTSATVTTVASSQGASTAGPSSTVDSAATTAAPATAGPATSAPAPTALSAAGWTLVVKVPVPNVSTPVPADACYSLIGSAREPDAALEYRSTIAGKAFPETWERTPIAIGIGQVPLHVDALATYDLQFRVVINGALLDAAPIELDSVTIDPRAVAGPNLCN